MRFKIDWAGRIVGSKFTGFALFYFVFEGNFPSTSPRRLIFGGAIYRRVFCVTGLGGLCLEGLIHGGAHFRNFTVYRGYYTVARRYEFYFRVAKQYFTNERSQ